MSSIGNIDEIPTEPTGWVIVQSKPMTQSESAIWLKMLEAFVPEGFFEYVSWIRNDGKPAN